MRFARTFGFMFAAALVQPASLSAQEDVRPAVVLSPGEVEVFQSPEEVARIINGNAVVADAVAVDKRTFYIAARVPGETTVVLMDEENRVIYSTAVTVGLVVPGTEVVTIPGEPPRMAVPPRPRTLVVQSHTSESDVARVYECGPPGRVCSPGPVRVLEHYPGGGGGGGRGSGRCQNPDDMAADGTRCGARAASVRPGGR